MFVKLTKTKITSRAKIVPTIAGITTEISEKSLNLYGIEVDWQHLPLGIILLKHTLRTNNGIGKSIFRYFERLKLNSTKSQF